MNTTASFWPALAFLLLLGGLASASADSLPVRTLAKGAFGGIFEPKQEVIREQALWEKLWARHTVTSKPAEPAPKVDFSKEIVIAVTMGRRNTGGYAIEITKVEPTSGKLRVTVAEKAPSPGSMAIQTLTAPFHFVAVPKSDLPVEFMGGKAPAKKP